MPKGEGKGKGKGKAVPKGEGGDAIEGEDVELDSSND